MRPELNQGTSGVTRSTRTSMAGGAGTSTGIYIGRVANNIDPQRMGYCEVEILPNSKQGTTAGDDTQTIIARYTSPFAGQTNYTASGKVSTYAESQTSYGFWAVPPDVGVLCVVVVAEGGDGEGFIVGYMHDEYMNQNLFNNLESNFNKKDVGPSRAFSGPDDAAAIAEWDAAVDRKKRGKNNEIKTLWGIQTREQREIFAGTMDHFEFSSAITSGARRDTPSNVYGWSSPGPPAVMDNAPRSNKVFNQKVGEDVNPVPKMRMGGTNIVMDDGMLGFTSSRFPWDGHRDYKGTKPDITDYNSKAESQWDGDHSNLKDTYLHEQFRITTRTGHRIIMHNSEDFIHIMHGSGMSWIHMSPNGKIDVFAKDGIHMASQSQEGSTAEDGQAQINLHACQVNVEAQDLNFSAHRKIYMEQRKDLGFGSDGKHRGAGQRQFALEVRDGRMEILTTNGFGISTFKGSSLVRADNLYQGNLQFHMENRKDNFIIKCFPFQTTNLGETEPDLEGKTQTIDAYCHPEAPDFDDVGGHNREKSYYDLAGENEITTDENGRIVEKLKKWSTDEFRGPYIELIGTDIQDELGEGKKECTDEPPGGPQTGSGQPGVVGDVINRVRVGTVGPHTFYQTWPLISNTPNKKGEGANGGRGSWNTKPVKKYEKSEDWPDGYYKDPTFTVIKTNLGRMPAGHPWRHEESMNNHLFHPPLTTWGKQQEHDLWYSGLEVTTSNFSIPPEGYQSADHIDCREYIIKDRKII
jgi:hypothetical protein